MGTISDSMGIFRIKADRNDTLIFRSLGFSDQHYPLYEFAYAISVFMKVKMFPTIYQLTVVDVFALTPQKQFEYDFIHTPLDDSYLKKQLVIQGVNKLDYRIVQTPDRPIFPTYVGGATGFIYKATKKGKSLQKLSELVTEDLILEENEYKYSFARLGEITGFTGDKLLSFYAYLNFSSSYISKTNGYDIIVEILRKLPFFETYYQTNGPILHLNDSTNQNN